MNIQKILKSSMPVSIGYNSPIDTASLNSFFTSVSVDIGNISTSVNPIIDIINSLKDGTTKLDATSILTDIDASESKDSGIFYFKHPTDPSQNRPLTIYESLLVVLQILSNTENGLREGIKVGNQSNKITIANNAEKIYNWIYSDRIFDSELFYENSGNTYKCDSSKLEIYVSHSDNKIHIKNISGSSLDIYGYIWHPVFNI